MPTWFQDATAAYGTFEPSWRRQARSGSEGLADKYRKHFRSISVSCHSPIGSEPPSMTQFGNRLTHWRRSPVKYVDRALGDSTASGSKGGCLMLPVEFKQFRFAHKVTGLIAIAAVAH